MNVAPTADIDLASQMQSVNIADPTPTRFQIQLSVHSVQRHRRIGNPVTVSVDKCQTYLGMVAHLVKALPGMKNFRFSHAILFEADKGGKGMTWSTELHKDDEVQEMWQMYLERLEEVYKQSEIPGLGVMGEVRWFVELLEGRVRTRSRSPSMFLFPCAVPELTGESAGSREMPIRERDRRIRV